MPIKQIRGVVECVAKLPKGLNATKAPAAYKPYRVQTIGSYNASNYFAPCRHGFLLFSSNFNPKLVGLHTFCIFEAKLAIFKITDIRQRRN